MADKPPSRLASLLLTVAIICIISGLAPQSRGYNDHKTGEIMTEWSLGVSASPLWEYNKKQSANGSFRFESELHYFSWSSLLLVIGAISLKKWYQLRRKRKKPDS